MAGEAFFITNGEPLPFWSLAQAVWYEYTGKERPFVVKIGKTVGLGLGWLSEMWARLVGTRIQDVGLTRHRVGYVTDHMYFDIEKVSFVLLRLYHGFSATRQLICVRHFATAGAASAWL